MAAAQLQEVQNQLRSSHDQVSLISQELGAANQKITEQEKKVVEQERRVTFLDQQRAGQQAEIAELKQAIVNLVANGQGGGAEAGESKSLSHWST